MKRHASLVPLSRDHHHGLVMAQRLILGRSTNPRADWPVDRVRQAARLVDFFETDLRPHFEIEEAHVFPAAARHLVDGDRRTRTLIAEHETMRAMIRDLAAGPTSRLEERLAAFGELLKAHIHTEERILFEQMQAACDRDVLDALGTRIAEQHGDAGDPVCRLS
jgi:hemerythrin-like domain-containing protein